MNALARGVALAILHVTVAAAPASEAPGAAGGRLRELIYDPYVVVVVPVQRGVVTLISLDADEAITEVATGLGSDCSKPEAAWCVAAQPGGRHLFVKPKSSAAEANNLTVVTDRRMHSFRLVLLDAHSAVSPVYRLLVKAPPPPLPPATRPRAALPDRLSQQDPPALTILPPLPPLPSSLQVVAERLQAKPEVRNTRYSVAQGKASGDIVPTLIFDDGRFTYLRLPGNRELPAVFQVLGDGTETLVNTRMEGDFIVVDRVSRRLVLRAGTAVIGIWNDDFDVEGQPPKDGTAVAGVQRVLRTPRSNVCAPAVAQRSSP